MDIQTIGFIATVVIACCAVVTLVSRLLPKRLSEREMLDEVKQTMLLVANNDLDVWMDTEPYLLFVHGDEKPDVKGMVKLMGKKYKQKKWEQLIIPAIYELKNDGLGGKVGV